MRQLLSEGDYNALGAGRLEAPDGRTYERRSTRMKRKDVAALVASGSPVVTYFPGGSLVWHDGEDTGPAWASSRSLLTTEAPDASRRESVTAGRWESEDAVLVVLHWHH